LLLVAALTSGLPGPGRPVPAVAWGLAAAISAAGAIVFVRHDRYGVAAAREMAPHSGDGLSRKT
jgi:hypothetical protein